MNPVRRRVNGLNTTDIKPPRGSEVFVGKIPRDLKEQDLLPLFQSVGPVYEVRLMLNRNGENRGFAFVTFANPSIASQAIEALNNYEIRPRQHIGVIRSLDNCRLFLGGIPKDKTEKEILDEMTRLTKGISRVIMYSAVADKSKNRGFAFVEYESHKAAAIARRYCVSGNFQLWGKSVAVDWAEPEPVVDEEILSKVRILYVRNLLTTTQEKDLAALFNSASDGGVEKVKIMNDYAFVHFVTRQQAEKALASLQNYELNGVCMQITWAKPMLRKNDQAAPKFPDSQYNSNFIVQQNPGVIGNMNPVPPANFTYPMPQHVWPYLPFPALPHLPYQNPPPGISHADQESLIPMHGMQGAYMEHNIIPQNLPEENRFASWPNAVITNVTSHQALGLTNESNHFYGFLPPGYHTLSNQSGVDMMQANFNGISLTNSGFHFAEVPQLS